MKKAAKKKVSVEINKLDQEYLDKLKERTGMSDAEILKFALGKLHDEMCKEQPKITVNVPPPIVIVSPPVIANPPVMPFIQPFPIVPFPYTPIQPYAEPTWTKPTITCSTGEIATLETYSYN